MGQKMITAQIASKFGVTAAFVYSHMSEIQHEKVGGIVLIDVASFKEFMKTKYPNGVRKMTKKAPVEGAVVGDCAPGVPLTKEFAVQWFKEFEERLARIEKDTFYIRKQFQDNVVGVEEIKELKQEVSNLVASLK